MKIESVQLTGNKKFELWYDEGSYFYYDDLWQGVSFISNHRDYKNQGEFKHLTLDDIYTTDKNGQRVYRQSLDGHTIVPIHAYIHGNIALSAVGRFSCPFDSGLMGFIIFKNGEFGENDNGVHGFVRGWEAILNGEVYGFSIIEGEKCSHCNHNTEEVKDSIGGFYGYYSTKEMIESMLENVSEVELTEEDKQIIFNKI